MIIPIRWGDMDAHHHVNNSETTRFFEEARVAWSAYHHLRDNPAAGAMIVAKATIDYLRPLEYPGRVISDIFTARIGNTSFTFRQTLTEAEATLGDESDNNSGALTTMAEYVMVWYDYANKKSVPLPQNLRDILEGRVGVHG
jgi:acyl-CoA thioester hydrolase